MKATLLLAWPLAAILLLAGCSRQPEQVSTLPATDDSASKAHASVDDLQIGGELTAQQIVVSPKDEFAPGEPIYLAMSVEGAPSPSTVSVHWYGPQNVQLGYESKEMVAAAQRLDFEQDNTADWRSGGYRAEVWIGDQKVAEKTFQIVAGV